MPPKSPDSPETEGWAPRRELLTDSQTEALSGGWSGKAEASPGEAHFISDKQPERLLPGRYLPAVVQVGLLLSAWCGRGREGALELDSSALSNPSPEMPGRPTASFPGSSGSGPFLLHQPQLPIFPMSSLLGVGLTRTGRGDIDTLEGPALPRAGSRIHSYFPSGWLHECPLGSRLTGGGCGYRLNVISQQVP